MRKRFVLKASAQAFRLAHAVMPRSTATLFRLGQALETLKDWHGAEAAYNSAVALGGRTLPTFLARRADVLARQHRWAAAVADCEAHPDVNPPHRIMPRLAQHLRTDGRVNEAIEMLQSAIKDKPSAKLLAALAGCYESIGEFGTALETYRRATDRAPKDLAIRADLGTLQARRSVVPFNPSVKPPARVSDEVTKEALVGAIDDLDGVMRASKSRTKAGCTLGRVLESHGLLSDAWRAYDQAVSRIERVNKPWAHASARMWEFRRSYVEYRISGQSSDDIRMNRTVTVGPPKDDLSDVAGFFEAAVTHLGLSVTGFVLQGHEGSIELYANGRPVLATSSNRNPWLREFKSIIVHDVLNEFPRHWTLTVRVNSAPLATLGGAHSTTVGVPDGTDRLSELLRSGYTINKKGRWSSTPDAAEKADTELAAYDKARQFFADELGIQLLVSYGTLLGCYRDGGPNPADDDFDVAYVTNATSPETFKTEVIGTIKALLRGGFDARVAVDGRMFHLRVDDLALDVSPFWFFDGRTWGFNAHNLSRDDLLPVKLINVMGHDVYIPAQTEAFLEDNYGSDWRIPRSDFHYHRPNSVRTTLHRSFLLPSEVRDLQDYSERLRADLPEAGKFHGYGDPADPRFR